MVLCKVNTLGLLSPAKELCKEQSCKQMDAMSQFCAVLPFYITHGGEGLNVLPSPIEIPMI